MFVLEKQVALITGASRGIGKATAIELAKSGADVIVHYNSNREQAEDTANKVKALGRKAYIVQADVAKHEDIKRMFSEVREWVGEIDILVNNAGFGRMNYVRSMTEEEWDDVLDTNLKGAFLCSKYASRMMMRAKKGNIINVSSIAAIKASVRQTNYSASKAGLNAMAKTMAKELGRFGIRVNVVAPGPIRTELNAMTSIEEENAIKLIPLGRIGEGEDVAQVISFLCSSYAKYVTGQVISVDGGLTL
ncbi:SDR family NAD(P)-dependent oxidoreductase [Bacillus cereus]|uniref:SDR family NAD(P)-dependent oxidoreductase n=1 Tax=Bacillus cereus TaxID=1396 RepID=UPI00065B5E2A|nr:3-oxoacyl-ACP reductase FabG [Bacillus cereus]KMQ32184.1 hypothetical protein TU58_01480 [Bacillus cereus]